MLARNAAALRDAQPGLKLGALPGEAAPCVGRDGSATFKVGGDWWRGCSVPRAASLAMLESLSPGAVVACYLAPMHPAAVRVALDMLGPERVLIAIVEGELELFLSCEDFSADLAEGRLRLATSPRGVGELLREMPGLPTPELLIRTGHVDPEVNARLVDGVQAALRAEQERRGRAIAAFNVKAARRRPARRVILARNGRFRLWDDAGDLLAEALPEFEQVAWHADRPAETTLLHVLQLASRADALVAPDFFRGDWNGAIPDDLPIVTWATKGRLGTGSPIDRLILANDGWKDEAFRLGWKPEQVAVAARSLAMPAPPPDGRLALIADLGVPRLTAAIEDFSSHRLACERIGAELEANPFRAGADLAGYVDAVRQAVGIPPEGFPAAHVIEHWALPIWQATLVAKVAEAGVQVDVWGNGWDGIACVRRRGEVRTREALHAAIASSRALLAPAPGVGICEGHGRPVVQATRSAADVARQAASAAVPTADHGTLGRALRAALG